MGIGSKIKGAIILLYLDRDGKPLGLWEWAYKFEDDNYRRVAYTELPGLEVSTIWTGLGINFNGPPEIFETIVFVELDEPQVVFGVEIARNGTEMYRWATEEQAIAGHDQIVAELRVPSSMKELK